MMSAYVDKSQDADRKRGAMVVLAGCALIVTATGFPTHTAPLKVLIVRGLSRPSFLADLYRGHQWMPENSKAAGVWEPTASPCHHRTMRLPQPHRWDRFKIVATDAQSDASALPNFMPSALSLV
jgi:hypothetical protein